MHQPTGESSRPPVPIPPGFVGREDAARISGIGITAWKRWESEGKLTCGQWLTRPGGGRLRIYPVDAIERMMREADVSFPPPGMVDRHEAARIFGVSDRTFSTWEKEGRIGCGRLMSVPGKAGQYKVYPVDELRRQADAFRRQADEAAARLMPYPDPDRPGVVRVPVSSNKHKGMEAIIDADDMPLVRDKRWNWSSQSNGRTGGGSVVQSGASAPLARIITGVSDPDLLVSHVNGDRLDYRRENLVVRTRSEAKRAAKRPVKWEGSEPYADPDRPAVARVPVSSEKHQGMEAVIDVADLPLIRGKRWNWSPGSKAGSGSVVLRMVGTPKPSLSRFLLGIDDPEQLVSHLNGDRLDCRRENLVIRTRSQVKRASKKAMVRAGKVCSSQFKGVTRTESGRKWAASIAIDGKYRNLGRFRSEVDAALAYDAALRELMGDGAAGLNLPDPAEVERLRALEPAVEEDPTWPPPGLVDRHEACRMFGVSLTTWVVWERRGRITCGQYHPLPNDKPGRCKLYPKDELERARVEIEKLGKPYADPDHPGVWRVPLKSYLTYREALIDEADLPIVAGRNWNWSDRTDGRVEGTVVLASTTDQTPLHRLILGAHGTDKRLRFLNGDPLDCRRANLSMLTLAEQVRGNRKMGSVSGRKYTSPYKGVSWSEARGKWVAQISKDQVHRNVGRFDSEIDAATAYDAAARVLFGEHGHLNFPDQPSTEQAMAHARHAMAGASNRKRAGRRRQRDLERELRRAATDRTQVVQMSTDQSVMISPETARQLFDVAPTVWERWQRFGWTPHCAAVDDDGQPMYRLAEIARLLLQCGLVVLPYPDPHRAGVYRVPLSGETAHGREALVDADAVPLVQTRRWRFAAAETGRGGEVQTMIPSENIRLHYVVMSISSDKELHVGHRNDDPLDCRRANLVVRTLTDTAANRRKQSTFSGRPCTSQFKGVFWDRRRKYWTATIKKDRVQRRLGNFRDELAAAQAYDDAARELFGEHARLNFPDGVDARLERDAATSPRAQAA